MNKQVEELVERVKLTDEEIEQIIEDAFRKDYLPQHYVESQGHWEKVAPIIAQAQLIKVLNDPDLALMDGVGSTIPLAEVLKEEK